MPPSFSLRLSLSFFLYFSNIWNNFNPRGRFNNFTSPDITGNRNWKTNLYCNSVAATAVAQEIVSDNHNSVHELKHHKFKLKRATFCSRFSVASMSTFFFFSFLSFFFSFVFFFFFNQSRNYVSSWISRKACHVNLYFITSFLIVSGL